MSVINFDDKKNDKRKIGGNGVLINPYLIDDKDPIRKAKHLEQMKVYAEEILKLARSDKQLRLAILALFKEKMALHMSELEYNPESADGYFLACLEIHHICLQHIFEQIKYDEANGITTTDKEDKEKDMSVKEASNLERIDVCDHYPSVNDGPVCDAGADVSGIFVCTKELQKTCEAAIELESKSYGKE
jgi:hypothetical protein